MAEHRWDEWHDEESTIKLHVSLFCLDLHIFIFLVSSFLWMSKHTFRFTSSHNSACTSALVGDIPDPPSYLVYYDVFYFIVSASNITLTLPPLCCKQHTHLFQLLALHLEDFTLCFNLRVLCLDQLQNVLALIVEEFQTVFNALEAFCCRQ